VTNKTQRSGNGLDVETLEKSFALIAPQAERLVERFYAELFRRHPAVRPMFANTNMRSQQAKLIAALQLVVANLRKPGKLLPALQKMGRRHEKYGARPEHYQAVATTLLDVMSEIAGPHWTPQVRSAWSNALGLVAKTMLGAYRNQSEQLHDPKQETTMNTITHLSLRWKLAITLIPSVAALVYFAWAASPVIALSAVAVTLVLGVLIRESNHADDASEDDAQQAADYAGQLAAISKTQAVIEFNMDGTIITANDNFLATLGYTLDEIQGQHHSMFAEPDFKASTEYQQFWDKLNRGEYAAGEYKRIGKGGKEIWIEASYNPIMDLNGIPFKIVKYATDITELKALNFESTLVRQGLENVTGNVMLANVDLEIVYMNGTASELFRDAESEIRKTIPGFSVGNMVGNSIDQFHKNPAHQRSMLADLNGTFESQLTLGDRIFKFIANPLFEENGNRSGTVVEWMDRTQELAVETEVQQVVDSALAGNLTNRISLDDKEGFFERLSSGVNDLVGVAEKVVGDTLRVFGSMATGDLTQAIHADYEGSFGKLKDDANATLANLTDVVGKIQLAADSVRTGSAEISQGNNDLSQRTEEQAASLEETASSMEEMTSTVRQNADNATQANQLAIAARDQAEKGGSVVKDAVVAMEEINASSKKIADIISVIDEIAFQTNLLALNASVEAARAGDQGRGFAVVASEVRNLAGRSATAAKEIKELIQDSGNKVEEGSRLVNQSGETLDEIVDGIKKVTDIVGEIAAASEEQSSGIDEINKAITQMDELTQQNAALVEEAAAASESLGEQATDLNQMMEFFTTHGSDAASQPAATSAAQPGAERRTADRPWSGSKQAAPTVADAPRPARAAAANGDAQEWEEF